jgi:hypothetical protein
MIEELVKRHSSYTIEFKDHYKLLKDEGYTSYELETFIFVPKSLGIHRHSYPAEQFYSDMKTYVRFKTPTILLKDMIDGPGNYYERLHKSIEALLEQPEDARRLSEYVGMIKMFCSILKSTLRDHVDFISQRRDMRDRIQLASDYLKHLPRIVSAYRNLRTMLNVPTLPEDAFSSFLFGDEFISLLTESSTFHLLEILGKGNFPDRGTLNQDLLQYANREIQYRAERGYPSIAKLDSSNEELLYRRSVLKKFVSSALYLHASKHREGVVVEQVVYSIAAGIAMIFATAAAFYAQKIYPQYSMALLVALAVGYMGKDRLKDLIRITAMKGLKKKLYDYKFDITTSSRTKNKLGFSKEAFTFLSQKDVPDKIRDLRCCDRMTEIENDFMGEHVLQYRKFVKIHSKKIKQLYGDMLIEGITDISRYNLTQYISKMDDPEDELYVFHGGTYSKAAGQKVYHINIISCFTSDGNTLYRRQRVIMNRNGVIRIEEIPL